jgi:transcriptional regulator GlxA family with amidase domain
VYVVLPPRPLLLDIAGPLEVLRKTNQVQSALRFEVKYVGPTSATVSSIGLRLSEIEPLPSALPGNAMVVISGDVDEVMENDLRCREENRKDAKPQRAAIVEWLGQVIQPGHKLICICSGALLAARAGLLDGYNCTTHHACCAELATLAPNARVLENRLYVQDGERYTSAGVTAGIDLMLHVISQLSDQSCVIAVARYLVVYLRRAGVDPQLSPWLEGRNHIHPAVHRVQDAMTAAPARRWKLRELAKIACTSTRHLSRLFQEQAGMSITHYKNGLRVALAHQLLHQTSFDMERIAERAGFGSPRQLRRAWRAFFPSPPREARKSSEMRDAIDLHNTERSQADFAPSPPLATSAKRTQRQTVFYRRQRRGFGVDLT